LVSAKIGPVGRTSRLHPYPVQRLGPEYVSDPGDACSGRAAQPPRSP
jgi:hypothetical protein